MSTSDGISGEDWDVVHELAVDLVNASTSDSALQLRGRLLAFLDHLESKYGSVPSILATRADYVDNPRLKESLLNDAHFLAESQRDIANALLIAHSLAELHLEEFHDWKKGREWLAKMHEYLAETRDDHYNVEYTRLKKRADEQEQR